MLIVLLEWYLYFFCDEENIFKKLTRKLKEHKTSKDFLEKKMITLALFLV